MNVDKLHRKLIEVARAHPPTDEVPYGFTQRVVARLREYPALDQWAVWAHALWRAAALCIGVMLLFSVWSWFTPIGSPTSNDLSQDFENTVLVAVDQEPQADSLR